MNVHLFVFFQVWFDYKSNLKRKLAHNKKEVRATGGGPNNIVQLTELEEQAVRITGIVATVEGVKNVSSFGAPRIESDDAYICVEGTEEYLEETDQANCTFSEENPGPSKKKNQKLGTYALLERQVEEQEAFHKTLHEILADNNKKMTDMVHYSRQINKTLLSINTTKKQLLEEQKRHNTMMEELSRQKLEAKRQILEMELTYIREQK